MIFTYAAGREIRELKAGPEALAELRKQAETMARLSAHAPRARFSACSIRAAAERYWLSKRSNAGATK